MLSQNPAKWAQKYLSANFAPIPLKPCSKQPMVSAWQNLKIPADEIPDYFDDASLNIGVVLGELSGGLVDVDLDCSEAVEAARCLLPDTRVFGRKTRPGSHYLYKCPEATTRKYQYQGTMLVELRSTGAQTMFPGSQHPDGELVRFENKTALVEITTDKLQRHVAEVAAAALVGRILSAWDTGRHDAVLALAGSLLHGGVAPDAVERFVKAVLAASGDEESADRLRAARDTIKNFGKCKSISGWPTLAERLPAEAIEKLREWLEIRDYPDIKINGKSLHVANDAAVAWAHPPELLYRELPDPEPYPLEVLGDVLQPMAAAMQTIIQAPAAVCAQSILAAASLAVQAHGNVEIDGRTYPGSLYLVTVADSGERKTAADREALGPHRKFQHDQMAAYHDEQTVFDADHAAWQRMRDGVLKSKDLQTREAKTEAVLELGDPPAVPTNPLLLIEEPTYEGLQKQLLHGWPSIGLFSDEGGRFIGGHGMNHDQQLKTAAGLSSLWDGSPITRVRSGEGATLMHGRRLALHLMIQPSVSALLFGNQLLMSQGLLSRLLVCRPVSTIGNRPYRAESLRDRPEAARYFARMMDLLERPLPMNELGSNELDPPVIGLDSDAKQVWIDFHDHIEALCAPGKELYSIKGLAAKAAESSARIALVLALVDNIEATSIQARYISAGIELAQFYLSEGLRLFDAAPLDDALEKAAVLLEWIQAHPAKSWTVRDLYRNGPRAIRSKAAAISALEVLENHGWVRQVNGQWEIQQ